MKDVCPSTLLENVSTYYWWKGRCGTIYTPQQCTIFKQTKKTKQKKIYNLNVKVNKAVILSIWDLPVGVGTVHMSICYDGFPAAIYNQPTIVKLE